MAGPLLLAIDQGTSGTKAILVDRSGAIRARGHAPLGETHPNPGWVEQDAIAVWQSVQRAVADCLDGQEAVRVVAVGLSNQRESVVLWDRLSGEPLSPVISWQDQRTAALCDTLRSPDVERLVRARSGLPLDPMFSAVKAAWLLRHHGPATAAARDGRLVIGTIDAWLLSRFGGEPATEIGNASRTQLLHVAEAAWDRDLLELFGIPAAALPRLSRSTGPFPATRGLAPLADDTPVLAVMGDSHAALFAHGAFVPGQVKATYGTGSSVMGLIAHPEALGSGACLTIGWQIGDRPAFAAEGNIRATGAALRWMAGIVGMSVEAMTALGARSESRGAVLVPGFTGLGAPWWDRDAVGLLTNLALDTGPAELARAAMESVVHQVADVVDVIGRDVGAVTELFTDGGPSRNDALMQMQADMLGCTIHRSEAAELSALGAAHMAGLGAGLWTEEELRALPRPRDTLTPRPDETTRRANQRAQWQSAVDRARSGSARRRPTAEPA
jgi:glycerol kinase